MIHEIRSFKVKFQMT